MCVCMCECKYWGICVLVYLWVCALQVYECVQTCVCLCDCGIMWVPSCVSRCILVYLWLCVCLSMCVSMYMCVCSRSVCVLSMCEYVGLSDCVFVWVWVSWDVSKRASLPMQLLSPCLGLFFEPRHSAGLTEASVSCRWGVHCTLWPNISPDSLALLWALLSFHGWAYSPSPKNITKEPLCADKIKIFILSEMTPHQKLSLEVKFCLSDSQGRVKFQSLKWNLVIRDFGDLLAPWKFLLQLYFR